MPCGTSVYNRSLGCGASALSGVDFSLECASAIITTPIRVFIDGKSYTTQTGKGLAKLLNISEADGDLLFKLHLGLPLPKVG